MQPTVILQCDGPAERVREILGDPDVASLLVPRSNARQLPYIEVQSVKTADAGAGSTIVLRVCVPARTRRLASTQFLAGVVLVASGLASMPRMGLSPIGVVGLGVLFLLAFLRLNSKCEQALRCLLGAFVRQLRPLMMVAHASPVSLRLAEAPLLFLGISIIVLGVLFVLGPLFGSLLAFIFITSVCATLSSSGLELRTWRGALVQVHNAWHFVAFTAVLLSALYVIVPATMYQVAHRPEAARRSLAALGENAIAAFAVWPKDTPSTRTIVRATYDALLVENGSSVVFSTWLLLLTSAGAALVIILFANVARREWCNLQLPRSVPDLPMGRRDKALLMLSSVLAAPFYWMNAILCVEIVTFLVTGHSWILAPLGWMLGLVEQCVIYTIGSSPASRWIFFAMVFPPVGVGAICLGSAARRLLGMLAKELRMSWAKPKEDDRLANVAGFVELVCKRHRTARPHLRIIENEGAIIWSDASAFGRWTRITLSSGCVKELSELELCALIAHEIGHVRRDAQEIERLKVLSLLLLAPAYVLLALYDFAEREHEADAFAVNVMGDTKALVGALVKLAVLEAQRPRRGADGQEESVRAGPWASWRRFGGFVVGSSVFAAKYPLLEHRLGRLRA